MITSFSGSNRFLSNFSISPIPLKQLNWFLGDNDIIVNTVEHAYQAMKGNTLNDQLLIATCAAPGKAKRLGRKIAMRDNWDNIKLDVMRQCLLIKFSDKDLLNLLLATTNSILIEGNTWGDRFWGAELVNNVWTGENNLGKLLMQIRDEK